MFVGLLVCEQDHIKSDERISMKLGWRMGFGPEWTLLHSGNLEHREEGKTVCSRDAETFGQPWFRSEWGISAESSLGYIL